MTVLGRIPTGVIDRRNQIWRHNGLRGCARMMHVHLNNMLHASTTTNETQQIAHEMLELCHRLEESLKTRREGT